MTGTPGAPTLGLAEAAKACGVSVSTLRRKRPELKANGAVETAKGWRIPVTALIALDLMTRTTTTLHEAHHDTPVTPTMTPHSDALMGELEALRVQLAAAEQRAAVAEAIAVERERTIQTQANALRMLEAGAVKPPPAAPDDHASVPTTSEPATVQPRPTLWGRLTSARRHQ